MHNKQVLITGGNAGVGFATAKELAIRGAKVAIIARNKAKGTEAVKKLSQHSSNKIALYIADLSSQKSIRTVCAQIQQELPIIDVLINNAGAVYTSYEESVEGIEMQLAVNHLAPFLLTHLLLPNLLAAPSGRIVNVSSKLHYRGKINWDDLNHTKRYSSLKVYGQAKLGNVLFTNYLATQLKDTSITVNSLHPGFVDTRIGNKHSNRIEGFIWSLFKKIKGAVSIEKGAETSVFLASDNSIKGVTGKYWDNCKEKIASATATDTNTQEKLWNSSLELCKIQVYR